MGYLRRDVYKEVTTRRGTKIKVLECEVEGLRKAGKLQRPKSSKPRVKSKEDKTKSGTKEEKDTGETK